MTQSSDEDLLLLKKCLSGDTKASETFVRTFSNFIYQTVQHTLLSRQVSFNHQDLEDLHNTVFLQLFEQNCKKLRQFQGKNGCSLGSWIRVITARIVLNHLRKKGPGNLGWQKKTISLEEVLEIENEDKGSWARIAEKERRYQVREGIRSLSPRDSLFMKLYYEKGLSIKEVADTLKISIENAHTVKHRAVDKLKSMLLKDRE